MMKREEEEEKGQTDPLCYKYRVCEQHQIVLDIVQRHTEMEDTGIISASSSGTIFRGLQQCWELSECIVLVCRRRGALDLSLQFSNFCWCAAAAEAVALFRLLLLLWE